MIMDGDQLEGCLRRLRAYWPGEWDKARNAVWAEAMDDLPFELAEAALIALGRSVDFPTVATFLENVAALKPHDGPGMFLPGSGWVAPLPPPAKRLGKKATKLHLVEARKALEDGQKPA